MAHMDNGYGSQTHGKLIKLGKAHMGQIQEDKAFLCPSLSAYRRLTNVYKN